MTPWTPAPPGGGGGQSRSRGHGGCFPVLATAPFFRSVKPEGLLPSGGNKPGGLPPPGVLYCLHPAAHPPARPKGRAVRRSRGSPPGPPLRREAVGVEAVPAGNVVVFFFIRHGPLFPQRKAGGPSALRRQQARWPSATGRPLLLPARRTSPCPPQRAGSPPVQGVTPWTPWRGRGRFLRLRRSRTCPRAGSAQSGSRHW